MTKEPYSRPLSAMPPSPSVGGAAMVCFEGSLFLLAVGIGLLCGYSPISHFHLTIPDLGTAVVLTLPPLLFYFVTLCVRLPPLRRLDRLTCQFVRRSFRPGFRSVVLIFVLSFVTGLGEETLFRGLIQGGIADGFGGTAGAVAGLTTASVLFGLVHALTPTYALMATGIGFYLGGTFLETGNLLVPTVIHALYDFAVIIFILFRQK